MKPENKLTKEDIYKIAKLLEEAYNKAGKRLTTANLMMINEVDGSDVNETIIDNRADEELN